MRIYIKVWMGLLLILTIFVACHCSTKNGPQLAQNVYAKNQNVEFKYDSISIETDSSYLNLYQIFFVYKSPESFLYYGYNGKRHQINILDLDLKKTGGIINLEKEGPNGIGIISSFFVHAPDSIFVFDNNYIALLDGNGTVLKRLAVNDKASKENNFYSHYRLFCWHSNELFYDSHSQKIYIPCLEYLNGLYSKNPKNFFKGSILAAYDLKSDSVKYLPVPYPVEYKQSYFGHVIQPYVSFSSRNGNLSAVYVTFQGLSNIYKYDAGTFKESVFGGASELTTNSAVPLAWRDVKAEDKKFRHFSENVNFYNITADKSSKYIFRFHYGEFPGDLTDYSNVYSKKKLIFTLFNEDLSIIKEIQFPFRKVSVHSPFTSNNILFISMVGGAKEDIVKFLKVTIIEK